MVIHFLLHVLNILWYNKYISGGRRQVVRQWIVTPLFAGSIPVVRPIFVFFFCINMTRIFFFSSLYYLQLISIIILTSSLFTCKLYINSQTQIKRAYLHLETLNHYAHFLMLETNTVEIKNLKFSKSTDLYTFYWAEYSSVPKVPLSSQATKPFSSLTKNFSVPHEQYSMYGWTILTA